MLVVGHQMLLHGIAKTVGGQGSILVPETNRINGEKLVRTTDQGHETTHVTLFGSGDFGIPSSNLFRRQPGNQRHMLGSSNPGTLWENQCGIKSAMMVKKLLRVVAIFIKSSVLEEFVKGPEGGVVDGHSEATWTCESVGKGQHGVARQ